MILVMGNEDDISTDYFMEWCHYLGIEVIRFNKWEAMNATRSVRIHETGVQISFNGNGNTFSLDEISAVWFRRGYITHYSGLQFDTHNRYHFLHAYFGNENATLNEFIVHNLKQKRSLNSQYHYNANKLITLQKAIEAGLQVPDTLISRDLAQVKDFAGDQEKLITKSIQDALHISYDGYTFSPNVYEVTVADLPEKCYYSKFQQRIQKKYELRIFFLGEQYYAAAIFTRNKANGKGINAPTGISRVVPYLLPEELIERLRRLNAALGLESGSVDMIVDRDDNHYFLEVNPVGQYDYINKLCNYYLDEKIAHYLQPENNEKTLS